MTEFVTIRNLEGSEADLCRAAEILRAGGLVVFPTETVYGLGGDARNESSAKKIYAAKGRPSDNPLIIHVAKPEDAEPYAVTCDLYYRLAKAFLPGPLTMILPKKDPIPLATTGGLDSVAVRCPSHPVAHRLLELCGFPVAAPSANRSGSPSPTCAAHAKADLDGRVDMILDGGDCEIGLESTIVKIDGDTLTLLRPGAITPDALSLVCKEVNIADSVLGQLKEGERVLSPGMKYRHYAPASPVILLDGAPDAVLRFLQSEQKKKPCAILCYDEELPVLKNERLFPVGARDDLAAQAKILFHALRDADAVGAEIIYAHLPPKEGLGLALYNRMIRAAAHTVRTIE
ncbi:MAG: threonylcarbamoyl-AMP synthase [Clostridia bacterium]|nr:threonylcarbamoyl-AMP synthase [Clostridia bacterium]